MDALEACQRERHGAIRGMAPADVLSKSKSTVSGSNEDFLLATVE